jgi:hypothetical protein
MRKLTFLAATVAGPYLAARWWRLHRRIGTDFVNPRRDDIGGERDWQCEIDDRD